MQNPAQHLFFSSYCPARKSWLPAVPIQAGLAAGDWMAREKGWVSGGVGPANALLSQSEAHLAGGFGYKPKITPYSILLLL